MTLICTLCLASLGASEAEAASVAMSKPLAIRSVEADRAELPVYERVTLSVGLEATYTNPFDSSQIQVKADVQPAEGAPWSVPGFLYQAHRRELTGDKERTEATAPPVWQVRLSFSSPGQYTVTVSATDASGTVSAKPIKLMATPADVPGMVRRHPTDFRYFVTDRGETLFLSGANVCWGGNRGTYNFDEWLPDYAEAGCNFFRVWLSPGWTTFAMNTPSAGYHGIDLGNAWRLDYVLETAERLGLRVMPCIDSFNIIRSKKTLYGAWEDSPYIKANGGPLDESRDYFTNEEMLKAYRDRLRYLVARYGYSPNVFAWEFWNEVDIIDNYDSETVTQWHGDMARYLRGIDPWRHLIGTSHARPAGDPHLDGIPELEFVQTHHYGARDMAAELLADRLTKAAAADRPHFHGEFGIGHDGGRTAETDSDAIHLHNALFASVGQMQAGTPMTWWWDSYVAPLNLYPVFKSFNAWTKGYDFVAQETRPLAAAILLGDGPQPRAPGDDLLEPKKASWQPAPFNKPMTVRVTREGDLPDETPLPRVLHGVRNHPGLHNPITFDVEAPAASTFGVIVDGVSGHGGAALQISLDGKLVREEVFADPDGTQGKTEDIKEYDGTYDIDVPAGRHTIKVENTGPDWFYVAYRIPWLRAEPPLRVFGVQGKSEALIWVQNRAHAWYDVLVNKADPAPVEGARLRVRECPPGEWIVEEWDTQKGLCVQESALQVPASGEIEIALPSIMWDAAYRLKLKE